MSAFLRALLTNESGQAVTEYVLLLVVLIAAFLIVGKALAARLKDLAQNTIGKIIQQQLGSASHTFRI